MNSHYDRVAADGDRVLGELGLSAGSRVLDVGTGSGNCAVFLARQGFRVVTGEPSTDSTPYAGQDWATGAEQAGVRDRIEFRSFDASAMPFAGGEFAAVFFYGVLHHIEEGLRPAVVREALRVAAPGAPVVFFEPRQEMLELLWASDPGHPPAADPTLYHTGEARRLQGQFMDVTVYRR